MKYTILPLLLFASIFSQAQITSDSSWTFISGDSRRPIYADYGTQGVPASSNLIGGRKGASVWKDTSGNVWVYGGEGAGFDCAGWMSDLWQYNISTNQWAWISGSKKSQTLPSYGTRGVAAVTNNPGSRVYATSWADNNGNLWLFGGLAFDYPNSYYNVKNDLWKFSIRTKLWTWVNGDTTIDRPGLYGVKGIASTINKPGGKVAAASWTDASGNFWMYGGASSMSSNGASVPWSDLWKYNPFTNLWTWMKGDSTASVPGVYGTQGVAAAANNPGAKMYSMCCRDANGRLWLFGGRTSNDNFPEFYNDLWRYDPATNNWTWIKGSNTTNANPNFGTQGVASNFSMPGARYGGGCWADTSGNIWLLGGRGYTYSYGLNNDLWKYNITTNQWAWINGGQSAEQDAVYGNLGIAATGNKPGSRCKAITFSDAGGNLYITGGEVHTGAGDRVFNDTWKFDIAAAKWIWLKGDNKTTLTGKYNTATVANPFSRPGGRISANSWTDNNGIFWLFGGVGNDGKINEGYLNDLWQYNPLTNLWAFMKGDTVININGNYGTKGIAAASNKPGSRISAASWKDSSGNLWLFGGYGYSITSSYGYMNDLWKYNIANNQWTWVKGDSDFNRLANYGSRGIAAAANKPGGRQKPLTWTDSNGDLWMFGGYGYAGSTFPNSGEGLCNDLWKYVVATNQWIWMGGSNTINNYANYGVMGRDSVINAPGARAEPAGWVDNAGNCWMYGGYGYTASAYGNLADVWKYNPTTGNWTFMNGATVANLPVVYGTQSIAAAANTPGGITSFTNFKDRAGNFWLFSGTTSTANNTNTLWKLNPLTGQWAWIKGDTLSNQYGVYGKQAVSNISNKPGARFYPVSWVDANDNFWLFGGGGASSNSNGADQCTLYNQQLNYPSNLNDLWKLGSYVPDTVIVEFCPNSNILVNSDVTGSSYQWTQSNGNGFTNITDNANFTGSSTAGLTITNIPAAWNNYLLKCIVNGNRVSQVIKLKLLVTADAGTDKTICSGTTSIGTAPVAGTSYNWTSNPAGFTAAVANPTVTPVFTTTYYLSATKNGCSITDTVLVKVENSWTGAVSTVWENPANWACNVLPGSTTDVLINSGLTNYPVITSNPVIASLQVKQGASVIVTNGYNLTVIKH